MKKCITCVLYLQARPVTKQAESEEDEEGQEKEEEDLSVPGCSYVKLMALTPGSVLPGKYHYKDPTYRALRVLRAVNHLWIE